MVAALLTHLVVCVVALLLLSSRVSCAISLNAVNVYVKATPTRAQSLLRLPGYRSNTVFTSACRLFPTDEHVGVSYDIGRNGFTPLRFPLFNTTTLENSSQASRHTLGLDKVVELHLGPFPAEVDVSDTTEFVLADLADESLLPRLLYDDEEVTQRPLQLRLFVGDTTNRMCLSLALYASPRNSTTVDSTSTPLMRWVPSSFGGSCGLRLAAAAQSALRVSPPAFLDRSRLDHCTLTHADEFVYSFDAADLEARRQGCYYVTELDEYKSRRYINCTFLLVVSGRATDVAEAQYREGALQLAAAVTQLPLSTADLAMSTVLPGNLLVRPVDGAAANKRSFRYTASPSDMVHRCENVYPGPGFWHMETPSCRVLAEQLEGVRQRPIAHVPSRWMIAGVFILALITGGGVTSAYLVCMRRSASAARKRWEHHH